MYWWHEPYLFMASHPFYNYLSRNVREPQNHIKTLMRTSINACDVARDQLCGPISPRTLPWCKWLKSHHWWIHTPPLPGNRLQTINKYYPQTCKGQVSKLDGAKDIYKLRTCSCLTVPSIHYKYISSLGYAHLLVRATNERWVSTLVISSDSRWLTQF